MKASGYEHSALLNWFFPMLRARYRPRKAVGADFSLIPAAQDYGQRECPLRHRYLFYGLVAFESHFVQKTRCAGRHADTAGREHPGLRQIGLCRKFEIPPRLGILPGTTSASRASGNTRIGHRQSGPHG